MAESTIPGPAPATVTESDWEALMSPVGGDGVIGSPSDDPVVYADSSGLQVKVRAGVEALIRGSVWSSGSEDFALAISGNSSGQARIDRVVVRLDRSTWLAEAAVVEGTPGAGAPALTRNDPPGGVWELLLADVTVPGNNPSTIAASAVTRRETYTPGEQLVVCTSSSRPSHRPGRLIFEADTGKLLLSFGNAWRAIAMSETEDPVTFRISTTQPSGTPTVGRIWVKK